jgi:hypothetical protein
VDEQVMVYSFYEIVLLEKMELAEGLAIAASIKVSTGA